MIPRHRPIRIIPVKVIVVGAGVIGCAIAYELAARGVEVHVVDGRGPGLGATRASAGILSPYIEGHSAGLLRLGVCSLDRYDRFISRVSADAGAPIEYRRTGTLQVARDDAEAAQLVQHDRALAGMGAPHSLLDGEEARRLEPGLDIAIRAALLIPSHGYVGAQHLLSALVRAAGRRGAVFSVEHVRAVRGSAPVRVETGDRELGADAVVIAAGSWSGGISLASERPAPVRPVRGQLLHLRVAEPPLSRVVWGAATYLVPWQDGSVLVGATVEEVGFDERVTVSGVRWLLDEGERILPALGHAAFQEARAGLRPATADELPIIGASSTMRGVYFATGHYRNGVLLAPLTATLMAELLVDGREGTELALVRPDRFGL